MIIIAKFLQLTREEPDLTQTINENQSQNSRKYGREHFFMKKVYIYSPRLLEDHSKACLFVNNKYPNIQRSVN